MQMKNEERIFVSENLEKIIDFDSLSSSNKNSELKIKINNDLFPVLTYVDSKNKYKVTFKSNLNIFQKLFYNQINSINICLNNKEYTILKDNNKLFKYKIYDLYENNYKIKIIINKETGNNNGI